jgi:hypothetical protein
LRLCSQNTLRRTAPSSFLFADPEWTRTSRLRRAPAWRGKSQPDSNSQPCNYHRRWKLYAQKLLCRNAQLRTAPFLWQLWRPQPSKSHRLQVRRRWHSSVPCLRQSSQHCKDPCMQQWTAPLCFHTCLAGRLLVWRWWSSKDSSSPVHMGRYMSLWYCPWCCRIVQQHRGHAWRSQSPQGRRSQASRARHTGRCWHPESRSGPRGTCHCKWGLCLRLCSRNTLRHKIRCTQRWTGSWLRQTCPRGTRLPLRLWTPRGSNTPRHMGRYMSLWYCLRCCHIVQQHRGRAWRS